MNKQELAKEVRAGARYRYISQATIVDLIETIMDLVVCHIQSGGERVDIRGFGAFKLQKRRAFVGSHPKTGERIEVTAKRSLTFKPSAEVVRRLNV